MLLSFFSYYPVILYITLLVENAKQYVQYVSSYFCYNFIFSRSHKKYPDFETGRFIKAEYLYELK